MASQTKPKDPMNVAGSYPSVTEPMIRVSTSKPILGTIKDAVTGEAEHINRPDSAPWYYQHNKATNDLNGNPRRCYCIYDRNMNLLKVVDEVYQGVQAINDVINHQCLIEMPPVNITVRQYKQLLAD